MTECEVATGPASPLVQHGRNDSGGEGVGEYGQEVVLGLALVVEVILFPGVVGEGLASGGERPVGGSARCSA
jgi:hypothetical protein